MAVRGQTVSAIAIAITVAVLLPARAVGQERRFELSWAAPDECPAAADVERDIAELLATSESAGETLVATAEVAPGGEGFVLRLTTQRGDQADSRQLTGQTCAAVANAAALVVALQIDPEAVAEVQSAREAAEDGATDETTEADGPRDDDATDATGSAAEDPDEPSADPDGTDPASSPTAEETAEALDPGVQPASRPQAPRGVVALDAALAGDVGTLASPSLGLALGVAARLARLRLALRIVFLPERFAPRDGDDTVGGELSALSFALLGGYVLLPGDFELSLSAGLAGGVLFGSGVAVDVPESATAPSFGLIGALALSAKVAGPLFLQAVLEGEAMLFRPQFQLDGAEIHVAGPIAGRLFLGAGVEFL